MTKYEAAQKIQAACNLVFSVEKEMDANKSDVRRIGYRARMLLGDLMHILKTSNIDLKEL